jgi:hypothetical protein
MGGVFRPSRASRFPEDSTGINASPRVMQLNRQECQALDESEISSNLTCPVSSVEEGLYFFGSFLFTGFAVRFAVGQQKEMNSPACGRNALAFVVDNRVTGSESTASSRSAGLDPPYITPLSRMPPMIPGRR